MLQTNKIYNTDCMGLLKDIDDCSVDILYTDPPYNMGSRYYIDEQGHYCFVGSGSDFMNQWDAMDGRWWYEYFQHAFRVTKYGGWVIMHNIDRQSDMWTYYARRAGFDVTQKLYWLFLTNFPKAPDITLDIDKALGVDRTKVGERDVYKPSGSGMYAWNVVQDGKDYSGTYDLTEATSDLAKKYDGYHYGQGALKQICEEILVFRKPMPNKETTYQALVKFEEGNSKFHPPLLNIKLTSITPMKGLERLEDRWTPQMVIMKDITEPLIKSVGNLNAYKIVDTIHKVEYEDIDIPYRYQPKTSKSEREEGLDNFETKTKQMAGRNSLLDENGKDKWASSAKNIHPTPKPLALCKWVIQLFALPDRNKMLILDTFTGQGSIPRAAKEEGCQYIGSEINPEYYELALAKLAYVDNKKELTLF